MKHVSRAAAVGLSLAILAVQPVHAEVIIPTNPFTSQETVTAETAAPGGAVTETTAAGTETTETGTSTSAQPGTAGQTETAAPATENGAVTSVTGPAAGNAAATTETPAAGSTGAATTAPMAETTVAAETTATGQTSGTTASAAATAAIEDPIVVAEGAVLLDASTGQVLFGKNQDQQFYPASITKVMTALLVLERCNLNDVVTFSSTATTNLESGASTLGISEGDQLTVEQCLYGLLLKSANEIGNGLAEHVAGSVSAFADLMNQKAASLGCKNTHFANPHGLNNSTHKTTPYDMALIMAEAVKNTTFRKIDTTTSYQFPATKSAAARTITMGHKMMYPTDSRYYEGIIGGKTGYTSLAGNTLVTAVERNGVRLVAVVMKAKGTHYTDTKAMLDYGFNNYAALTAGNSQSVTGTTTQETTGWVQTASGGWYYVKADGTRAANEWQTIKGSEYWFDSDGSMATGWRQFTTGDWYYFAPEDGHLVSSQWIQDGGNWYYVGTDGALLRNTTTPDGYPVDENGIWKA